jgi:hypothetical protein
VFYDSLLIKSITPMKNKSNKVVQKQKSSTPVKIIKKSPVKSTPSNDTIQL